ncbi:carbohydrate kinase [Faecalicatena sp. Marseille-Q4148]|nr:carbohydrate kinase [Faecalicatena sp. Marseille-Q4148]
MNSKKYDVIALGELLIDFIPSGKSEQGNELFEANPGGAPCNVLSMLQKVGRRTAFIGKVGEDEFGFMLRDAISSVGIDSSKVCLDPLAHTTLAFVHKLENGDRDFSFYRNPGADVCLAEDEVEEEFVKEAKIFHFGTLSMTHEHVRKATEKAIKIAEQNHLLRSFDPNLREPLWEDIGKAKEQIRYGLAHCDILKISDNEVQFVTGKEKLDEGMREILSEYPNITLACLTLGKDGSKAFYKGDVVEQPGFRCNSIETTGAGDTFCGSMLHYVLKYGIEGLDKKKLKEMLIFANAAAALVTTRKGALYSMPEREEIEELIQRGTA